MDTSIKSEVVQKGFSPIEVTFTIETEEQLRAIKNVLGKSNRTCEYVTTILSRKSSEDEDFCNELIEDIFLHVFDNH